MYPFKVLKHIIKLAFKRLNQDNGAINIVCIIVTTIMHALIIALTLYNQHVRQLIQRLYSVQQTAAQCSYR